MTEITREEIDAKIETKFVGMAGQIELMRLETKQQIDLLRADTNHRIDLLTQEMRSGFAHQSEMIVLLQTDVNETKAFVKNSLIAITMAILATIVGSTIAVIAIIVK